VASTIAGRYTTPGAPGVVTIGARLEVDGESDHDFAVVVAIVAAVA